MGPSVKSISYSKDSIEEKSGVKKCLEIMSIKGGGDVRRLMEKSILNFHFDYLNPSLSSVSSLSIVISVSSESTDLCKYSKH